MINLLTDLLLTLLIASIPVAILLYYFAHKDKGEEEPKKIMRKVFLFGILITIPLGFAEYFIDQFAQVFFGGRPVGYWILMPFLFVALPEEFGKLWVVKRKAYDHHKFNEVMDGITYCIVASMGFAILENILYTAQFGLGVGVLRAFTAVPAHALFSGIMGHFIGLAKFTKDKRYEKELIRKGLIAGFLLHGSYNFLLMSGIGYMSVLIFPLLAYMWIILHRGIRAAHEGKKEELNFSLLVSSSASKRKGK